MAGSHDGVRLQGEATLHPFVRPGQQAECGGPGTTEDRSAVSVRRVQRIDQVQNGSPAFASGSPRVGARRHHDDGMGCKCREARSQVTH